MFRTAGRSSGILYVLTSAAVALIVFLSPARFAEPGIGDIPFFVILGLHALWGLYLVAQSFGPARLSMAGCRRFLLVPEILGALGLLLFLFVYIFATNANMDYVQRFIAEGGNLRLAVDTRTQRLLAWVRYFPLVALDLSVYLSLRVVRYPSLVASVNDFRRPSDRVIRPWALLLVLLSALLSTMAMPSFVVTQGIPILGWFAMVPLFLVLRRELFGRGVFYIVVFGVFTTLLSNYWLGTFNLISLLIVVTIFLVYYLIFAPVAMLLLKSARWARTLVLPLAWTAFEYLRSIGFLGYPWALFAHSQYTVTPIIQLASVTGVWGVSLLVLVVNAAVADFAGSLLERHRSPRIDGLAARAGEVRRSFVWLAAVVLLLGGVLLSGALVLATDSTADTSSDSGTTVRVAQIQQNSDPRKAVYEATLDSLTSLTDSTLTSSPDIVVWPEAAFVPNIRRSSTDTSSRRYHRLVTQFLEYQRGMGTWLLTGNDDYEIVQNESGEIQERYEYNAAILFDPSGLRKETYRKIQLVPFTEHFPYQEQLPGLHQLLLDFDVYLWEPGSDLTVFEHPLIRFSTPICYEDVFPDYVRGFVTQGAEAIFNISNDYWSLTPVQATQHFAAGLFRAVENRRPVLRTTVSGLTGQIDPFGRIIQTAGYYEETTLVSDVSIPGVSPITIYTRWGDWFPAASGSLLLLIAVVSLVARARSGSEARGHGSPSSGTTGKPSLTSGLPTRRALVSGVGSGPAPKVSRQPKPKAKKQRIKRSRRKAPADEFDETEGIFVTPRYPNGKPVPRGDGGTTDQPDRRVADRRAPGQAATDGTLEETDSALDPISVARDPEPVESALPIEPAAPHAAESESASSIDEVSLEDFDLEEPLVQDSPPPPPPPPPVSSPPPIESDSTASTESDATASPSQEPPARDAEQPSGSGESQARLTRREKRRKRRPKIDWNAIWDD